VREKRESPLTQLLNGLETYTVVAAREPNQTNSGTEQAPARAPLSPLLLQVNHEPYQMNNGKQQALARALLSGCAGICVCFRHQA